MDVNNSFIQFLRPYFVFFHYTKLEILRKEFPWIENMNKIKKLQNNTRLPKKSSKKKPLTAEEKDQNSILNYFKKKSKE